MDLLNKTALITGSAVRIGRAMALALVEQGCQVVIHYGSSHDEAVALQQKIKQMGGNAEIVPANLTQLDDIEALLPTANRLLGPIDILINNASIFPNDDTFTSGSSDQWDTLMTLHGKAPYLLSQAFVDQLPDDRPGKIININDASIPHHLTDHFLYRLSKNALWEMTLMMAKALAPRITVNQIAIGSNIPPPGWDEAAYHERVAERVPLGRAGTPDEVAQNIIHLLQQDYLTGVTLPVDGGEWV